MEAEKFIYYHYLNHACKKKAKIIIKQLIYRKKREKEISIIINVLIKRDI